MTQAGRTGIHIAFDSTAASVRRALQQLCTALVDSGLSADSCGTVQIAVAEALNNVVEHAYGPEQCGTIDLRANQSGACLVVRIRDRGRPLPGLDLPARDLPSADVARDSLPEGGFGWFLIRTLCQDLSYDRDGDENHLSLSFCLEFSG